MNFDTYHKKSSVLGPLNPDIHLEAASSCSNMSRGMCSKVNRQQRAVYLLECWTVTCYFIPGGVGGSDQTVRNGQSCRLYQGG